MYVTSYRIDNHNDERVVPCDRDRRIGRGQDSYGGDHWRIQHYFADTPAWLVLGKGEEEPLPLALLPVARFEGGGEGEHGVRRQVGLQVQAQLRLTRIQVDRPDRLGPLLLPRVDHQLGGRFDRGGRPSHCACQAAVFYNLLNFHIFRRSDLDKGLIKQRLRFARVTSHHHTVIDDSLQTEQSSLVDVDQVEVLAGIAVPEQLRTIVSWWKRAGHFFCLSFPPHRSVLNILLRVEVWHPGLEKSGEPLNSSSIAFSQWTTANALC